MLMSIEIFVLNILKNKKIQQLPYSFGSFASTEINVAVNKTKQKSSGFSLEDNITLIHSR